MTPEQEQTLRELRGRLHDLAAIYEPHGILHDYWETNRDAIDAVLAARDALKLENARLSASVRFLQLAKPVPLTDAERSEEPR